MIRIDLSSSCLNVNQKKVMLYGQSAGALDAFVLATLPQAPQLFGAAVFESGGGRDSLSSSTEQALGRAYAQALDCSTDDVRILPTCAAVHADVSLHRHHVCNPRTSTTSNPFTVPYPSSIPA